MELDDLLASYAAVRLIGRSESNRHQYRVTLSRFVRFLGRRGTLADLTDANVGGLMQSMLDRGRSPATANKSRDHLTALWRFAHHHRLIDTWPEIKPLVEPERIPVAWTIEELQALLAAASQVTGMIGSVPASEWWTALILVLWETGERIGAVLKLDWSSVRLSAGTVVFRAETRKGRRRDRLHFLHADTIDALRRLANRQPIVFYWDRSYSQIWDHYKRILKAAGLPTDRKSQFHRIRKTTASYYKRAGGNPTELLDHSSERITRAYLDPAIIGQRPAHELLPRLSAPSARPRRKKRA